MNCKPVPYTAVLNFMQYPTATATARELGDNHHEMATLIVYYDLQSMYNLIMNLIACTCPCY